MCRGPIAEDTLVEVPPDYESQQNEADVDTDQPWYSSSKVSLHAILSLYLGCELICRIKNTVKFFTQ